MTRGRTRPTTGVQLDVVAIVVGTGLAVTDTTRTTPERQRLLALCGRPQALADLASDLDLPIGVVRVLVGDLIDQGLLRIQPQPTSSTAHPDQRLLRRVLDDLRAL
ncbi:DUF742 domain-containing protein [Actinomadura craniellae]|nr:DUF742 domain-containing protein [Actinomadura craniellae]